MVREVQFLNVQLIIGDDRIISKGFRKSTTMNALLHNNSHRPRHVKKSLPYSQFLRLRRVNSEYSNPKNKVSSNNKITYKKFKFYYMSIKNILKKRQLQLKEEHSLNSNTTYVSVIKKTLMGVK